MIDYTRSPAFPMPQSVGGFGAPHVPAEPGMSLRDYFAAGAPVDFKAACNAYGCEPDLSRDADRAAFYAVWALLRYEYADAMLAERATEDRS